MQRPGGWDFRLGTRFFITTKCSKNVQNIRAIHLQSWHLEWFLRIWPIQLPPCIMNVGVKKGCTDLMNGLKIFPGTGNDFYGWRHYESHSISKWQLASTHTTYLGKRQLCFKSSQKHIKSSCNVMWRLDWGVCTNGNCLSYPELQGSFHTLKWRFREIFFEDALPALC